MWHGFSWKFHVSPVTNWRQFGPNLHQIPWLFHVIYTGFICFPYALTWHGVYRSSSHGISMAFAKKMIHWISSDLVIFNETAKRHKKLRFTFFAAIVWFIFTLSVSSFEWNMIRWNHALCFLILRFIKL